MYKLLSHNDLDGVGCGILAKLAFGKQVNVRYNSVGGIDREVSWFLEKKETDTFLFVTDLSVNEENEKKLDEFYQNGGKVKLIDHHKTALHINQYDWGHIEVEDEAGKLQSATSLYYEYLVRNEMLVAKPAIDEFVELVRLYDTWEWEKSGNLAAQRLNALFFLISIDEFEEKMLERLKENEHFYFDDFEKRILDMEDDKIDRYIRRKRRELIQNKIGKYYVGIVFAESYHSELGNELGKDCWHLDYIAIVNMGSRRMGFRTIHDDVDVSQIASEYGGGGHAKASGCTITDTAYKHFVEEVFHLDPIREDARRNRYNLKGNSVGVLFLDPHDSRYMVFEDEGKWKFEKDHDKTDNSFLTFQEAEKYLKRNHAVWLSKDDEYVNYLIEIIKSRR
ncbi:DHH family phosphoesterase [Ornithinibacillus scapharcae]|uniref:DHH family phosphoesterase n=1 Tax=Ornithinibacillus scapharcae TaxID=1147159 RepID=UPI000225B6BA|nr:oligoribonuclease [Ornithinibacillus scapharcae]